MPVITEVTKTETDSKPQVKGESESEAKPKAETESETKPKAEIDSKVSKSETKPVSEPKPEVKRFGFKNWDRIAKELGADDEDEADADQLFKKLYASADEDTQRAMNKSYVESNGTTLSMDWKKVGKKFVKPYKDKGSDDELSDTSDSDFESGDGRKGFKRIDMKELRDKYKP